MLLQLLLLHLLLLLLQRQLILLMLMLKLFLGGLDLMIELIDLLPSIEQLISMLLKVTAIRSIRLLLLDHSGLQGLLFLF